MQLLNHRELHAIDLVSECNPLGAYRKDFHSAMRKLHFATGTDYANELPEKKLNCDYSLKWVKANRTEIWRIVERYQRAVYESQKTFWKIRSGK